jgi:hypothetical protein
MPIITAQADLPKTGAVAPQAPARQLDTAKTVDAPKEEIVTKEESLSPKFAALARKERAIRSQQQALKQREEAFKAKESEYESKYVPKERLSQDTLGVLQEMGISYDQLTTALLNQGNQEPPEIREIRAELKKLREEQTSTKKTAEESQTKAYEQAITTIRNQAKMLVDSNENFETIKATGSEEMIVDHIKEEFDKTGIVLSVEEAAQFIEDALVEDAFKYSQLKKVQARLNPAPVEQEVAQKSEPQLKTLTAQVSASSKPMTNKERRERAIAAFRGQLK